MTYLFSRAIIDNRGSALLASVMLGTSWGFFKATHVSTPDLAVMAMVVFSSLVFWSWLKTTRQSNTFRRDRSVWVWLQGITLGLLLLLGGTIAVLFPLCLFFLYLLLSNRLQVPKRGEWLKLWLTMGLVTVPWFIWTAYQQKQPGFIVDYFIRTLFCAQNHDPSLNSFGNPIVGLFGLIPFVVTRMVHLLPWTLFVMAPFTSYFWRHGQRRVVDFREEPFRFLLIWVVIGLGFSTVFPVLVLPPLCLMTSIYLTRAVNEARVPRSFVLATELTTMVLLGLSVLLAYTLFHQVPNDYPGVFWFLPGPVQMEGIVLFQREGFSSVFPVWKVWLLPGLFVLLMTGILLNVFYLMKRFTWVVDVLALGAVLFCLYVNVLVTPIFSRPVGEHVAQVINTSLNPGDRVFLYTDPTRLSLSLAHVLFSLNYRPMEPVIFPHTPGAVARLVQSFPKNRNLFGVTNENRYYQMPLSIRQHFRVIDSDWAWYDDPFRRLLPGIFSLSIPDKEAKSGGKVREHVLLIERIPPDIGTRGYLKG